MLQNQRQALWTFDGTCKTCEKIMLQNQRQTKNLYRIDSNQNLYRIILEVFTKKQIQHMFTWYFLM